MWLLQLIGMLAFLFFVCYLFAAMGNHGRYKQHHENNLGCALMLFFPVVLYILIKAIFGH
jgi:hypothetical protein